MPQSQPPFTTFAGQPVNAHSILVGPELLGDADLSGTVDLNDLNIVLNNLGTSTSSWTSGNFDGAATIDINDLNAVLNNLSTSIPAGSGMVGEGLLAASPAATPEPASLTLLSLAAPLLLRRRRHA